MEEVEEADQEEVEVVVEKEEEEVVVEKEIEEEAEEAEEEEDEQKEGVVLKIQEDAKAKKDTEWMCQRRRERCVGQLESCQMVREEHYLQ